MILEKAQLIKLVNESSSLSDVLRKQGKSVSGTSISILRLKLLDYGIKTLFIPIKNNSKQIPLSDILVENKPYNSSRLKKRLIESGLKLDICELCGLTSIWNGKHLSLLIDHINGNHNDNRLENLRIVCPNCHTLTETFSNKRNKSINNCVDCGKQISKNAVRCCACARNQRKQTYKVKLEDRPNKEYLLELIMTKSFSEIGKIYDVSDNAIRKWCKRYGLPYTKKLLKEYMY